MIVAMVPSFESAVEGLMILGYSRADAEEAVAANMRRLAREWDREVQRMASSSPKRKKSAKPAFLGGLRSAV